MTSGASAPEHLVQDVVEALKRLGAAHVEEWELVREDVSFGLPAELQKRDPVDVREPAAGGHAVTEPLRPPGGWSTRREILSPPTQVSGCPPVRRLT